MKRILPVALLISIGSIVYTSAYAITINVLNLTNATQSFNVEGRRHASNTPIKCMVNAPVMVNQTQTFNPMRTKCAGFQFFDVKIKDKSYKCATMKVGQDPDTTTYKLELTPWKKCIKNGS